MKRYGSVIRVRPEKLEEYKLLHAEVWPGVRKMIAECGLRNYSIYYKDGYLFSYYEYVGDDYEADMAKMAADPETQRWLYVSHVRSLWKRGPKANGGPQWRRCFIKTDFSCI